MRVTSLFAGIGGFDLAAERAGMTVTRAVEIDKRCQQVLRSHFHDTEIHGDITQYTPSAADLVCGGFPCQDISVAGSRAGLAGTRSGLWWEFVRVIDVARPRWVVIENVAGLLHSNRGRDMGAVLGALAERGYGYAYRVLDAQWTGVPQRRRRVFIVGCARGDATRAGQVLLEPEGCPRDSPPSREEGTQVVGTLDARTSAGGFPGSDGAVNGHVVVANAITARLGGCGADDNFAQGNHLVVATPLTTRGNRICGPDENWIIHARQDPITSNVALPLDTDGTSQVAVSFNQRGEGRLREVHASLNASHSVKQYDGILDGTVVRRLTPLECERLQGFPDGWTEGHSDTQRYRMLGNAVAVPVVEWIMRRITACT